MNKIVITIGRQFGAGGRKMGKKLAETLNIPYYDKEILAEAAKVSGLCKEYLEQRDECSTNSLLYSFVMGTRTLTGQPSLDELAWKAQWDAVQSIAEKGSCIIVGRCADYILRQTPGLLRVFLVADEADRIRHVSERDGLTPEEAARKIRKMEKMRASYYNSQTEQFWGDAANYDLCLNVSHLGEEKTLKLLLEAVSAL